MEGTVCGYLQIKKYRRTRLEVRSSRYSLSENVL